MIPMRGFRGFRGERSSKPYQGSMSQDAIAAEQQRFMVRVYSWMTGGLGITGFMALYVASSETMRSIVLGNMIVFYGLIIGQLGLVFYQVTRRSQITAPVGPVRRASNLMRASLSSCACVSIMYLPSCACQWIVAPGALCSLYRFTTS